MCVSISRRSKPRSRITSHEVDHAAEQIFKLEKAIDEAVAQACPEIRSVIEALQALRAWPR